MLECSSWVWDGDDTDAHAGGLLIEHAHGDGGCSSGCAQNLLLWELCRCDGCIDGKSGDMTVRWEDRGRGSAGDGVDGVEESIFLEYRADSWRAPLCLETKERSACPIRGFCCLEGRSD